jgi:mRNA interferase RelE/StbE
VSKYSVYITPAALREIKDLPGNVRQRVKRAVTGLQEEARPAAGKDLDISEVMPDTEIQSEVWRLRLDKWRIVYVIADSEHTVDVLAIRKRPPYDYGDLQDLLANVG